MPWSPLCKYSFHFGSSHGSRKAHSNKAEFTTLTCVRKLAPKAWKIQDGMNSSSPFPTVKITLKSDTRIFNLGLQKASENERIKGKQKYIFPSPEAMQSS